MITPSKRPQAKLLLIAAVFSAVAVPALVGAATPPPNTGIGIWTGNVTAFRRKHGAAGRYRKRWNLSTLPTYVPERQLSGTLRIWGLSYLAAVKNALRAVFGCALLIAGALPRPAAAHQWNLTALPAYQPQGRVTGTIRLTGTDFSGLIKAWERAFRKLQPGVSFTNDLQSSDIAMAAMITGSADIAPAGREPSLDEILGFTEKYGYSVTPVIVGTGAWKSNRGNSWAPVIFVNRSNPIKGLTLAQLDGIFGAERSGGYGENSVIFNPLAARGPDGNLRTWGQLGLTGAWKSARIQTYGYADTGMRHFFELKVFHGGDKWNENYREYVESGTKMVPPGSRVGSHDMLVALSHDGDGIGWSGLGQAAGVAGLKALPLAKADGGPYFPPNAQNCRTHHYPLCRVVFMYVNRPPGRPLNPATREFLRFVLSRDGQGLLAGHSLLLPLTKQILAAQRRKLQ